MGKGRHLLTLSFFLSISGNVTNSTSFYIRCAVVTGANKGIGLEICRQLASQGIIVILTARDDKRGREAVENLKASGLNNTNVVFHQLDVKDPTSIASLADFIRTRFTKLDILVNNAADGGLMIEADAFRAAFKTGFHEVRDEISDKLKGIIEQTAEKAIDCLKTNYYGAKRVTEALMPYLELSNSPRIVNVSSVYGLLMFIQNEKVKSELNNIEFLTEERVDELLQWFLEDFKEDKLKVNGWPTTLSAYKISKAAMNAYTRILAKKFPNMRINSVHPGYVKTDITCNTGAITAEEGARAPVMLALLQDDGPSGHFFNGLVVSPF